MYFFSVLAAAVIAQTTLPFHDQIPQEFVGTFAPQLTDCGNPDGVELITVSPDGVHYYEGDDYLLLGIKFAGASTKSGKFIPLFNGRFTGRSETALLGEVNARMEMENIDTLIRYRFDHSGQVDPKPVTTWVRCPVKK